MMCLKPIRIRDPAYYRRAYMQVPCGKCYACRTNQRTEWTVRNQLELQMCAFSLYVTLTYDDDSVPVSSLGLYECCKYDVQTFLKRYRKWLDKQYNAKLRYFITAEYGEGLRRPHYHCLFYYDVNCNRLDTYDELERCWGHGHVNFGSVETASIHYCMKYIMKFDEEIEPLPYGLQRPFRLTSRKPGLGALWLDDNKIRYYANRISNGLPCRVSNYDQELSLPRFLKNKCLKLPWDVQRSVDFFHQTIDNESRKDHQRYSHYLASASSNDALSFEDFLLQYPRWRENERLNEVYKEAYIKHLREHVIKL